MKSIREAAMSKEDPEEIKTQKLPYDSDRYDGIYGGYGYADENYGGYGRSKDYLPKNTTDWKEYEKEEKNKIVITMKIDIKDIGRNADSMDETYDPIAAETKATEIAHERLELLLNKNYELKHSVAFSITECYDEYDVEVTLIPLNK